MPEYDHTNESQMIRDGSLTTRIMDGHIKVESFGKHARALKKYFGISGR